ncbi:MAG TPA: type 4a pilus biogenesis protein PilO [Gammaproteobacteria bacterium]|nr:type 4a pilus biogenesis protein PilO [Gammaproteobacteria bacterium]
MTLDDLNNLDFQDLGSWPLPVKFFSMILLFGLILFAGWYFDVQNQRIELAKEEKKETELLSSLETKQKKAANLDALKRQMEEMQQSFGDMLRQLPNKTEVAGLLVDISQTGLAAGLEFELFKPGQEVPSEFYAELPIQIGVVGDYHKFGEFISGIASLPRIVTTHDINITKKGKSDLLAMSAIAKTYRALDEDEFSSGKKPAARGKRGGRR